MFCQKCGIQLESNTKFCPSCGVPVNSKTGKKAKKKPSLFVRIILVLLTLIVVVPATLLCIAILSDSSDSSEISNSESDQYNSIVSASTAQNESTVETVDDSLLVDNEFFTATYIGAQDQSDLGVFYVTLKIENKTDAEVFVSVEDADVDGETVQMVMTGVPLVVRPGNSGQTGFIFPMSNLGITSMDEAEQATFRIVLRNNETLDIVAKSDLVTVDLVK